MKNDAEGGIIVLPTKEYRVKKEKKFFRTCPNCGKQLGYTNVYNRDYAESAGKVCKSCCKKGKPCINLAYNQTLRDAYTKLYGDKYNFPNHYFDKWSIQVKKRDSYTCQKCAKVGTGCFIDAHHIVPSSYFMARALDTDNGITLCRSCHQKLHRELDTYTLHGKRLNEAGFITHFNEWKPTNGKK